MAENIELQQAVNGLQKALELAIAGCTSGTVDSELMYRYVDELGTEHIMDGEYTGDRFPIDGEITVDVFP